MKISLLFLSACLAGRQVLSLQGGGSKKHLCGSKFFTRLLVFTLIILPSFNISAQQITKTINAETGFLEIKNGLCGIVIPWKSASTKKVYDLAPIQSFVYKDGMYSDTSINYLKTAVKPYLFSASIVKESTTALTIKLDYRFKKPKFDFYGATYKGGDAGPGYYIVLITIRKGRKSITIEEDTNYDIDYLVGINQGLHADKARYRGYSSDSKEQGYEPDGKIYRAEHDRGYGLDATVDLDFATLKYTYWWPSWEVAGGEVNTGRYWQFFNSSAAASSNIFGYFQGKPSVIRGGTAVGPTVKSNIENNADNIELMVSMNRRGPDNSWFPRKRVQWNAFISTKEDILSAEKSQPIGIEMNYISGLGSRIRQYANAKYCLVPAFYNGAIYLTKNEILSLIARVKKDKSFYNYLISMDDGLGMPIWDSWQDSAKARNNIEELLTFKTFLVNEYINGDGSFSLNLRYWKGVRTFRGKALLISGLFADKSIKISNNEKKELESLIGIMGRILWDDDNVPIIDSVGVNLGNANMVHQYVQGGRNFFALLLANDPIFRSKARSIVTNTKIEINNFFYANGSTFGTPHYIQPAVDPLLFLMLQIRQAGLGDLFNQTIIKAFAGFYTSLLSPPSVRFNNNRKLISLGDGSAESAATFGLLGAGFKPTDASLSIELYSIFFNGPVRASFAGPTSLAVDLTKVPLHKLTLTSSSYDGYQSNIRLAVNSTIESVIWAINGNKYFDHRNDDAGELVIYALGAPLSLSRSSFYYPRADAASIRSMVIPADKFPEWAGRDQPINGKSYTWAKTDLLEFAALKDFTAFKMVSYADSTSWYRQVIAIQAPDSTPIIIIKDSVSNNKNNIWSMNMLSEGPIMSSNGALNPIKKQYFNGTSTELPEGTPPIRMPANWNYFKFHGQNWPLHNTNGIDWDLYTYCESPLQASAAYWATNWQNTTEQSEFSQSNKRPYEEAQQILRLNHKGLITTILLPRFKGRPANQIIPDQNSSNILIKHSTWTLQLFSSGFVMHNLNTGSRMSGLFSSGTALSTKNISISGGPQEVIVQNNIITIQVAGNAGERIIEWPQKVINLGKPLNITTNKSSSTIRIPQAINTNNVANGSIGYQQYQLKSN